LKRRIKRAMNKSLNANWFYDSWKPFLLMVCCSLLLLHSTIVSAQSGGVPRGWILGGDHAQDYATGIDKDVSYLGHPCAYLKSKPSAFEGFGTLMQRFDASQFAGKRVQLSAWVKSQNVDDWAGLWMRVDSGTKSVAFDNMQNRAIKGTTGWQRYAVILQVPQDVTSISFGVLVNKSGTIWLNSVQFEAVGTDVPLTDMWAGRGSLQQPHQNLMNLNPAPTNLSFAE
jgi:hypothetical protein